jgi:hypothetical protein
MDVGGQRRPCTRRRVRSFLFLTKSPLILRNAFRFAFTLFFAISFSINLVARLVLLGIFVLISLLLMFQPASPRLSNRALIFTTSAVGAWLFACGVDLWVRVGFVDAPSLFVSKHGVFEDVAKSADDVLSRGDGRFKGLLAGMWLYFAISAAIEYWRYSSVGGNVDEVSRLLFIQ